MGRLRPRLRAALAERRARTTAHATTPTALRRQRVTSGIAVKIRAMPACEARLKADARTRTGDPFITSDGAASTPVNRCHPEPVFMRLSEALGVPSGHRATTWCSHGVRTNVGSNRRLDGIRLGLSGHGTSQAAPLPSRPGEGGTSKRARRRFGTVLTLGYGSAWMSIRFTSRLPRSG